VPEELGGGGEHAAGRIVRIPIQAARDIGEGIIGEMERKRRDGNLGIRVGRGCRETVLEHGLLFSMG